MDPSSIADDDPDWVAAQNDGDHKGFGRRQVQMIAVGGAIGTASSLALDHDCP